MKDKNVKQIMLKKMLLGRGGQMKRKWIWLMYFLYTYEYGTFKPVEVTIGGLK
jgi:hypothetical protein